MRSTGPIKSLLTACLDAAMNGDGSTATSGTHGLVLPKLPKACYDSPEILSRMLLRSQGYVIIAHTKKPGPNSENFGTTLAYHPARRSQLAVIIACHFSERFSTLMEMLSSKVLADIVRIPSYEVQLHAWRKTDKGFQCDEDILTAKDYGY